MGVTIIIGGGGNSNSRIEVGMVWKKEIFHGEEKGWKCANQLLFCIKKDKKIGEWKFTKERKWFASMRTSNTNDANIGTICFNALTKISGRIRTCICECILYMCNILVYICSY